MARAILGLLPAASKASFGKLRVPVSVVLRAAMCISSKSIFLSCRHSAPDAETADVSTHEIPVYLDFI